jgi:hypothetical protein
MELITERPEGMDFELYKIWRKAQEKSIKHYLRGKFVFTSKSNKDKVEGIKGKTFINPK